MTTSSQLRQVAHRLPLAGIAAVLTLGAVGLSGCGVNEAAAAAVVDGKVIRDSDVQVAAAETNRGVDNLQTQFTARSTLPWLIIAPFVLEQAAKEGKAVSDAQARSALTKLDDPSPATVEFVRAYIAAQSSLSDDGIQTVLRQLRQAKITVNPRYGTFNPDAPAQLSSATPAWVRSAASPTAPATVPPLEGGRPQEAP